MIEPWGTGGVFDSLLLTSRSLLLVPSQALKGVVDAVWMPPIEDASYQLLSGVQLTPVRTAFFTILCTNDEVWRGLLEYSGSLPRQCSLSLFPAHSEQSFLPPEKISIPS
eukprot:Gb_34444 [translate_table: standard]